MISYEYRQFLNEKVLSFLPTNAKRVGNKIHMRCPLCGDSKKSSTKARGWYYLDTASYFCFNCSTGLSGIKFLEFLSGYAFDEIKKEYIRLFLKSGLNSSLSAKFEHPGSEPTMFQIKSIVNPEWKKPLSNDALQYLANRKVLDAPFSKNKLFSCYGKNNNEYILIPWKLNGLDAYYQLNDFKKIHNLKYIFPKDKKKLIAGLDNIDISWPYIIVFEGYFDSVFVKNGICVGTKSITDYQLQLIKERYPNHQIVISFDNDSAGIDSMCKLLKENRDFKYFKWFNKNTKEKDINDYILAKNNVNIFIEPKLLEKLIVDKLLMKLWLIQNNYWK